MPDWLTSLFVNPALLWGGLLVSVPVLIHILSRRRFRVVEWAAIDLLIDADRRNRRRIRLEHLIILLLRCLAVLLIALLVARPTVRRGTLAAGLLPGARFERIVLLDDSASMGGRRGVKRVFDTAREGLIALVRDQARERPGDTFTLLLTSRPDRPVLESAYLTGTKAEEAVRTIEALQVSDRSAAMADALLEVRRRLETGAEAPVNHVVTLVTDLRRMDWTVPEGAEPDRTPPGLLARLAERAEGATVVRLGDDVIENVSVVGVRQWGGAAAAHVPARFEVTVRNTGTEPVSNIEVAFGPGTPHEAGAVRTARIPRLQPGTVATESFTLTPTEAGWAVVHASLPADALDIDNTRLRPFRVREALSILLVDGEPTADPYARETLFLERALAPPGNVPSGNRVTVVGETGFEHAALADHQIVFLCNVYRLSEARIASLAEWVREGGGLVVFLGGQVSQPFYNDRLVPAGLMPAQLTRIQGDASERAWVNLSIEDAAHPVLRAFGGEQNPFMKRVKVFQWWGAEVDDARLASGEIAVPARFSDAGASPAIVEGVLGEGRVLLVTTTADGDWTSWPTDVSYPVTVLEMVRRLAPNRDAAHALTVGAPIVHPLDATRFRPEARLRPPGDAEAVALQAAADPETGLALRYDDTRHAGLYALALTTHDGGTERVFYAASLASEEGDLRPADREALLSALGDAPVTFVDGFDALTGGESGARTEFWRATLLALVLVLCAEQFLAWWFGRRR